MVFDQQVIEDEKVSGNEEEAADVKEIQRMRGI